eukprot:TRINITY_DN7457_c2_g1_i2.p1 TRINITY_DN7457_c2_g1~~TRINITY_DN7457_c2_g1_i2.p1  ORF type:complete len:630 (-),score=211.11 TRINITY_DN7457_c2_g1_i2:1090-2979(-)
MIFLLRLQEMVDGLELPAARRTYRRRPPPWGVVIRISPRWCRMRGRSMASWGSLMHTSNTWPGSSSSTARSAQRMDQAALCPWVSIRAAISNWSSLLGMGQASVGWPPKKQERCQKGQCNVISIKPACCAIRPDGRLTRVLLNGKPMLRVYQQTLPLIRGEVMAMQGGGEEYNQYWRTVINTMQDGLMVVDPGGLIVSVNPAFEQLTGYAADELVGQPCSLLECDSCDYPRGKEGEPRCGLFKEGAIKHCRCTLRKKDGSPLYVVKNAAVIPGNQGEPMGGVETLTDLSEVVAKERELTSLRRQMALDQEFQGMVGRSPAMLRLFSLIESAAESDAPVLISGESGTGKEMVAEALHRLGRRSSGPLIKVNCAALNENVLESELFGHVKGAFTGADSKRMGRFEAAKGGDFLLDEVGDLPPATQVKLLRVLQEKVIERVGDHRPIPVDVRIISATNRDLKQLVAQGRFREDLYYRVAVVPISTPALRERRQDVPLLVETFLKRILRASSKDISGFNRQAMDLMQGYDWPGNVRELINALEYAVVLCPGGLIGPEHLPEALQGSPSGQAQPVASAPPAAGQGEPDERERIIEALRQSNGRREEAARLLGISRVTLWKKMKNYQIQVENRIL